MMVARSLIFLWVLLSLPMLAYSSGQSCGSVFDNWSLASANDLISNLSTAVKKGLGDDVDFNIKDRLSKKLANDLNPANIRKLDNIDSIATDLWLLINQNIPERQTLLKNRLFKTKAELTKEWVGKQIIAKGLLSFAGSNGKDYQLSLRNQMQISLKNLFNNKYLKWILIPIHVPNISDINISQSLLTKIMIDGMDAHSEEIKFEFNSQKRVEIYNSLRKLYSIIGLPLAITLAIHTYPEFKKASAEWQKTVFIQTMEELNENMNSVGSELNKENARLREQIEKLSTQRKT